MATPNVGTLTQVNPKRGRGYCMPQTAAGVMVAPLGSQPTATAGGPFRYSDFTIGVKRDMMLHEFSSDSGQPFVDQLYQDKEEIPFTVTLDIIPPENLAGTIIPQSGHFMAAALGAVTIVGGTSITYSASTISLCNLLTLCRIANYERRIIGEWLTDCVIDTMKISWSGGETPKFEFSGYAKTHIMASSTTLNGAMTASTTMVLSHPNAVEPGAILSISAGTGHVVDSRNSSTSFELTVAATAPDASEVRPWAPTPVYSSAPACAKTSAATLIGGSAKPLNSLTLEVSNNLEIISNEIGSAGMTDAVPNNKTMKLTTDMRLTEDVIRDMVAAKQHEASAVTMNCGLSSTAGSRFRLSLPNCIPNLSEANFSGASKEVSWTVADTTEGANDAISCIWD